MDENWLIEFANLMFGVATATGGELSDAALQLYQDALQGYPVEDIERAAGVILSTWRYTKMPPVALFLEALGESGPESLTATARIEAAKVIELCSDPRGNDARITDPVTRLVLAMRFGGLAGVGHIPTAQLGFFERDFVPLYEDYARRGVADLGRRALDAPRAERRALSGPQSAARAIGGVLDTARAARKEVAPS